MSDNERWAALFGGLGGYALGKNQYKEWDDFIKKTADRVSHLKLFKAAIPFGLFKELPNSRIWYHEGVRAFIYGLPNASLPLLFKCLELSLKRKYQLVESKNADHLESDFLINWADDYLKDKKDLAHGFRLLRNLLHKDYVIKEQEVSQAIYNISLMLNLLFPSDKGMIVFDCQFCKKTKYKEVSSSEAFIGNSITINKCDCSNSFYVSVFP